MKPHPSYIFQSAVRVLFFLINLFAIYLTLRGHNLPGGGFIGGLVTAISLVLLRLALGLTETHRILRVDPVRVAAFGLTVSVLTATAPLLFGQTFFQHSQAHFHHVPLLGDLHIGTPLFFDIGVYLVVVGITSKIIFVFGKSTQGFIAFEPDERARYSSSVETPVEPEAALVNDKEVPRAD